MEKKETKGLVLVFTGNGKGKTTSALGLVVRAAGHGLRVAFIQFIKGSWQYGELEALRRFADLVDLHVMGRGFTWKSENLDEDRKLAMAGWELAKDAMQSGKYHLVVLDEFTYLLKYGFLDSNEVLQTLTNRPAALHVAITGRYASEQLIELADLVTEMQAVKHPYQAGIQAQKGIEF